jgi:hypothetical protein
MAEKEEDLRIPGAPTIGDAVILYKTDCSIFLGTKKPGSLQQ